MSNINQTYDQRVQYYLYHRDYGTVAISPPEGWADDEKEFERHSDYLGMVVKLSNSLKFHGDAAEFILLIDGVYGVNADLRLTKMEQHPQTDLWELAYEGWLDLSTRELEDGAVSVKFNSGGIEQILKTRNSEDLEIERDTTMDGKSMDALRIDKVLLKGRKILLDTKYEVAAANNTASVKIQVRNGVGEKTVGVPLKVVAQSHEEAQDVTPETTGVNYPGHGNTGGTTGMMFFEPALVARELNMRLKMSFTTSVVQKNQTNRSIYYLAITKYSGGVDYIRGESIILFDTRNLNRGIDDLGGPAYNEGDLGPPKSHTVDWTGMISLNKDESLALEFYIYSNLGSTGNDGFLRIDATNITAALSFVEDSFYEQSQSNMVLAHELGDRIVETITSFKGRFKSDYFGRRELGYEKDGPGAYLGFAHGFWVRGFDKYPLNIENESNVDDSNVNPFKQLTTSFDDFYESMRATSNIGLGIEKVGRKEYIRIEDLKYFFNRNVTIRLPNQIQKEKRYVATDYFFSGIEIGYEKGGEYEESMGLDEYNTKNTYTTVITRLKNVYSQISKYRADSYGKEFARRKPKAKFPTEDSTYDNDIFVMDLKRGPSNIFEERVWQDDFQKAPTGVYSPDTATNLRLSPFNLLLRHSWCIAAGFIKYPSDYVRYGSSTANSKLKTQLKTDIDHAYVKGFEYAENGNIVNSELERARFEGEWLEFEHIVDFTTMKMIEGYSTFGGKQIPNFYGLVEVKSSLGLERGFLFNVKPNGSGKWKVLKVNNT